MPLTKLDNLISSKTGRYLYVSPDDFNASDALDNRGNSPTRPFLTIQRAFLEVARYSYVPGKENDRFDQFTIMLSPGNHYIDNRPGVLDPTEIEPFSFDQATGEWTDSSIVDLKNPNNILYKFNGPNGGATIPRGTSLVGMDLRRTRLHPLYVPDPADKDIGRTTLFNVTGGCYFWQFTILDGDVEKNSPLYDEVEGIGKVYSQPNSTIKQIPYYSHHKICNFEFADKNDLGLLYRKIARAFSLFQPTIDDPGEFTQRPQENRIVGPLQDAIRIDSIKVENLPNTNLRVTVKTKVNHGYYVGQAVAVANLRSTLPAGASEPIPLLNDPLTGVFAVSGISVSDPKEFSYVVNGKNAAAIGLADKEGQFISPPDLDTNAITQAEVDSVESASPYVFNVSIRSTWGICGIHADGSKATGFKSMVIAQYTGVSLQRDDRAFIRYDEFSNTWNQAPLTDAFATTPYHTKGDAYWKDDWRNFHVKASNDAFIQNVSIFAVGFADHFLMESGGDMSITNSNSNFGNTSLHAIGYKGFAFNQDQGGYIDGIIPPRTVTTDEKKLQYYTFNQVKTRNDLALNYDSADGSSSITTKLYLGHDESENPLEKPSTTVNGYKIGAKANDKLYVKLDPAIGFTGSIRSADVAPSGYRKWNVALEVLSPSASSGISNNDQDAANLIDLNREFIAAEAYGYITRKYPYILTRDITITKCRRDLGYILEAVSSDLRVGGNVNSLQAGQSYYVGTELNYINEEKTETIEAINYARSLAIAAMRNWEFFVDGCSVVNGQNIVTVPNNITTVGIVEGMEVNAIVSGGQNNPIPSNTYVKKVISNTQFELGNRNATDSVNATATVTGSLRINFELTQSKYASSSGRNFDAANLIRLNKDFIANEALYLAKQQYPTTVVPNDDTCKRDIKYVLDAVADDISNFGNAKMVEASEAYVGAAPRYRDAKNLILNNKQEIVDKAAAKLAIDYPDFYYGGAGFTNGGDPQTNVYSRYKDSYRLIQLNKKEITEKAIAKIAIDYPDFYFPGDQQTNSSSRGFDSYRLIQLNRQEIIETAFDAIEQQYPTFVNPNSEKCRRDIGHFIDAVSMDVFTGGNYYSREFSKQYFNGNTPISNGLVGEEAQSVFAFTTASTEMKKAVTNNLTIKDLTITPDPDTGDNTDPTSCANIRSAIDTLTSIINNVITSGNINNLPAVNEGTLQPGQSKCLRDIGYFVDAVSTDLTTLGNAYSIGFVKQYFVEDKVKGKILTFEQTTSTTLANRANRSYTNVTASAITGNGINAVFSVTRNASGAISQVTLVSGGYNYQINDNIKINGSLIGGQNLVDDLVIKVNTVETAWITAGLQGEEQQSIAAFTSAIEYCKKAISNQLNVKDLTLTGDPLPGDNRSGVSEFGVFGETEGNTDPQSCANVKATLDTLSNIIFNRINAGDLVTVTSQLAGLPEINYGSAPATQLKCKRDIGFVVEAVATDLALGGNSNIIDATKFYFDSTGTALNDSLAGEIPQSVAAFNAARDLCMLAVTNQLNYKDLEISDGPSTVGGPGSDIPNTSPNACADVRSAISSLFGIITGKLQNPSSSYPTLAYNAGASSLEGELDISVYAFEKVRDLAILAMRNWKTGDGTPTDTTYQKLNPLPLGITVDPSVDTTTAGIPACADTAYAIATEFDILIGALTNTTPLPPKNFGSSEYIERTRPQKDTSVILDTSNNKCASTKTNIIELMRVITDTIRNGLDSEELVSQTVNTASFAERATLFKVSGSNPHNLETGTPVRLVAVPRIDESTGLPVNVDKKYVRLPKGLSTNTKYYVIAPGKITFPYNYSRGGASSKFRDTTSFMLASSIENATAGIYIYSSETDSVNPDVQIELHQYVTDVKYDLHRYTAELVSSRVFRATTNHVFDTAFNGVDIQRVFFRPLNGQTDSASLEDLPTLTSGGRLSVARTYFVGRPGTYDLEVENPSKSGTYNREFSIYLTKQDAIDRQNAVQFNYPSGEKFLALCKKRRSPLGYDPVQDGWYINTFIEGNEIRNRLVLNNPSQGSSYVNKPPKTPDSFFYRFEDTREPKDKIYRLRYVMPSYRDDVRDPIRGFILKGRTDEKRKLLPQRVLLKPLSSNDPKAATFFEVGVQSPQRLGVANSANLYDPYNPTNRKRIEGTSTESNVSFTIQSARIVDGGYLEMNVFDLGLDVESLKAKRFVTVKLDQPQGGNGEFIKDLRVSWSGASTGSAIVHSWFGTENVEGKEEEFYYLILKDIEGELKFDPKQRTTFKQQIFGSSDIFADLSDEPNFGKEDKNKYLYAVEAANVYTMTPGDVITDDAARQYRVVSVEDVEDLKQTYYIYEIEEVQRRIPRQQDGVYYLTVVRGDISPFPTGSGVGTNFRNFKFSQPISRLYPLVFKNDPLLFQYDGSNDKGGIRDTTILDPNNSVSAADNYIHGLVTVNDAKNSVTKEAILDFINDPGSGTYEFTGTNILQAQEGSAGSGAEERNIPIAGDSQYPLEQKLYVELRRPSIARAGNHTFEYLGFGPGNYSTGFPARQTVILTDVQDYYAQSKRQDAGIVFYTGINSNGELYIGNRKINAITGQETFLDATILEEADDEGGEFGSLVTVFEDPVTFENIITLNAPPNLKNFFNSPVEVSVDPEFNGAMTPPSFRIFSRPGDRRAWFPGDDDPLLDSNLIGDVVIDKNRVVAAIFDFNSRGTQRYSMRTSVTNRTPNQNLSGANARIDSSQTISFGSAVPLSGDILFKGEEVGYAGSLGWIYANSYVDFKLNPQSEGDVVDIIGIELYPLSNVIRLIFQEGKVNFSTVNPGASLGITRASQIRISGATGVLSVVNGVHNVYDNVAEGKEYLETNTYVYVLTTRASSAVLSELSNIYGVNSVVQPTIKISRSDAQWKEVGVIGAEALRTYTETYGDYRLGINTLARAFSTDYLNAYTESTRTQPRANLDVVGTAFISGRKQTNFADRTGGTPVSQDNAVIIGGDSAAPDGTAVMRISTTNGGRIGINTTNAQLNGGANSGIYNTALSIIGNSAISGNLRIETDLAVNGGDITTNNSQFTIANQTNALTLNLAGYATSINVGNVTTSSQTLNIGDSVTGNQTLNIGNSATGIGNINIQNDVATSNINIGTGATTRSVINIGGAYTNRANSILTIQNYNTTLDGILNINGGTIAVGTTAPNSFTMFPTGLTDLSIGLTVGNLTLGGVAGTTRIRNGLNVLGTTVLESDVIQNGGFRNSSVGVDRNIFGTIQIATVARSSGTSTIVTTAPHGLTSNQTVQIKCSDTSFNTVLAVPVSVTSDTSFTYSNAGANVSANPETGTVITGVGRNQTTGSLANLNIDYYSTIGEIDGVKPVQTVTTNKLIVSENYFSPNDAIKFIDVGNLTGVTANTIYYVLNRDNTGFTISQQINGSVITIGLATGTTDAGSARVTLFATVIDTAGDNAWGSDSYIDGTDENGNVIWNLPVNNPAGIGLNQFYLIGTEIVQTVNFPPEFDPTGNTVYNVKVLRAQRGTVKVSHPDGEQLFRLVEQQNASYIFPNPVSATDSTINIAEFSGTIRLGDLLRINKLDLNSGGEYVRISQINTSDAQTFVINNGDFGSDVSPQEPLQTFRVITTSGNTQVIGDVTIGYDTTNPTETIENDSLAADTFGYPSSTSVGAGVSQTGGGNLKVHNSIELSGNTSSVLPEKQYFVITNGSLPKFYVESASGNTKLYNGANLQIYKDSFFASGKFDKSRIDTAVNLAFEVLGNTGNTKIAGSLRVGDDFRVGTLVSPQDTESAINLFTNRFTIDAQTGDTYVGRYLTINGNSSASPTAGIETLTINGLGVNGSRPFVIKQDASIDAFGYENFYSKNGGRRTLFVSSQGNTDSTAINLRPNVNYLTRAGATLVLRLPVDAVTGDIVRIVDIGGALNFAVNLVVRAPAGVRLQNSSTGSRLGGLGSDYGGGELIVNTPNAGFGLVYVGDTDSDGAGIAGEQQGWYLMEI